MGTAVPASVASWVSAEGTATFQGVGFLGVCGTPEHIRIQLGPTFQT